jgi:hypothetical protein
MRIVRRQVDYELTPDETSGPANQDGHLSHHGFALQLVSATVEHVTHYEQLLAADRWASGAANGRSDGGA